MQASEIAPPVPARDNTVAVVVLYNPEGDLAGRLSRVISQVGRLIVVANDGGDERRLGGLQGEAVIHVSNQENRGLAAAINQGLAEAARLACAWCLLLDQDSLVDQDLIAGLAEAFVACPQRGRIGLLVPNYRNFGGAKLAYGENFAWQLVPTAVTSGSLVPLHIIRKVGGMFEPLFIESIDLEFCLRLRAAGWLVVASGRPLMTHGAGAAEERWFFGRVVLVAHHPPQRWFLQFRNLIWTLRHYGFVDFRWAAGTVLAMLKRIVLLLRFEHMRVMKLRALACGVRAGFARKLDNRRLPYMSPVVPNDEGGKIDL